MELPHLKAVHYQASGKDEKKHPLIVFPKETKTFDGVDIYFDFTGTADELAQKIEKAALPLKLKNIFNRGVAVWPSGMKQTFLIDSWRCRFMGEPKVAECLEKLKAVGLDAVKTENLYSFNGKPGYSLAS